MNKTRLEVFSDGIFAIAITLLVLTIAEPSDYKHLERDLVHSWPELAAFVVSFAVIGIMWLNHHAIFAHLETVDRAFIYLNFLLLMTIAFLPFPTGVFGEALRQGEGTRTAAVFYSATMAINAYAWTGLWLYASVGRRLLSPDFPEASRPGATIAFTGGSVAYSAALGIAFINSDACLAFQGALAVYYALDPISRHAEHGAAAPDDPQASADSP